VAFTYVSRSGRSTARRVEPYRQVLLGRHWYLLAFDRDRDDWRTFRIDRIADLEVASTQFAHREPPSDPVSFVQGSIRRPQTLHRGSVVFEASAAFVADRLLAEAGTLVELGSYRCRYLTPLDSWSWLAMTVAMVGVQYRIESPQELIEESRSLAERIYAASRDSR
jgi:predicted DNA-binding transcriptional regulator YafY